MNTAKTNWSRAYNTQDYYPFGMLEPGRNFNLSTDTAFRFGFNKGSERDDDIEGKGDLYTTQFREYDSRLGRWWSIDPEAKPYESPYAAFGDNPLFYNDPSGESPIKGNTKRTNDANKTKIGKFLRKLLLVGKKNHYAVEENKTDKKLELDNPTSSGTFNVPTLKDPTARVKVEYNMQDLPDQLIITDASNANIILNTGMVPYNYGSPITIKANGGSTLNVNIINHGGTDAFDVILTVTVYKVVEWHTALGIFRYHKRIVNKVDEDSFFYGTVHLTQNKNGTYHGGLSKYDYKSNTFRTDYKNYINPNANTGSE